MTIEEALEIIDNTNFYVHFTNGKQDEAFDMAYRALKMFEDHKKILITLDRMKGDHIAQIISSTYHEEIEN